MLQDRPNLARSTSPHPSLSSSGSEEVRCSLDELDAVIATFDEEARQHHYSLSGVNNWTCAKTAEHKPSGVTWHCSALLTDSTDPADFATVTLRVARPRPHSVDQSKGNDSKASDREAEFPPPPPDLFGTDNFVLPPPPPSVDNGALESGSLTQPNSQCSPIQSRNPLFPTSSQAYAVDVTPTTPTASVPIESPVHVARASGPVVRPMVPRRAPSTRLSTVQMTVVVSDHSSSTNGLRSPNCMPDNCAQVRESQNCPGNEKFPCKVEHLKQDQVPYPQNPTDHVVNGSHTVETSAIEQTVPPVVDIIRKFDSSSRPNPIHSAMSSDKTFDKLETTRRPSREYKKTTNLPSPLCLPEPTDSSRTQVSPDGPDTTPLPNVQELARGFTAAAAVSGSHPTTIGGRPTSNVFISPSPLPPIFPGPASALPRHFLPSVSSTGSSPRVQTMFTNHPAPGEFTPPPPPSPLLPPGRLHSPTAIVPLSSFGQSGPPNQTTDRHQPQPPYFPSGGHGESPCVPSSLTTGSTTAQSRLEAVETPGLSHHAVSFKVTTAPASQATPTVSSRSLDHSNAFFPNEEPVNSSFLFQMGQQLADAVLRRQSSAVDDGIRPRGETKSVHALRLDPATLETLVQFNVVDANQIPGYQDIPMGIPDWKAQRIERKNRQAAAVYATDLRKWGKVPQWKRELIEKRQHQGKPDPISPISPTDAARQEVHSIISAELTAKLQRRLEKVDSTLST
ncbi:hypothetical protein PHET_00683 [Paragonimus heterotremus]|uniref:Uncharacterized protein n=1 Tax=Paragonimus heterotremus TaxID=100268 RepID=A0A8J4WKS0_9TREM|nr:hypothetical protein PHET_00683 [Paragonimus heterotremus]